MFVSMANDCTFHRQLLVTDSACVFAFYLTDDNIN